MCLVKSLNLKMHFLSLCLCNCYMSSRIVFDRYIDFCKIQFKLKKNCININTMRSLDEISTLKLTYHRKYIYVYKRKKKSQKNNMQNTQ